MKKVRTIGSLILAMLVIAASSHFFIDVHVCGDKVKAVSFLSQADGCGHAELPPCHRAAMKGCCDNEQFQHAAQDLKKDVAPIIIPVADATAVIHTIVLAELIPSSASAFLPFISYDPPLPSVDRSILHAVFLI